MELGKLKILQVPGGLPGFDNMLEDGFFACVDSVLLEIAQQQEEKLKLFKALGNDVPDSNTLNNAPAANELNDSSTKSTLGNAKLLFSIPYHPTDRELSVARAVDFVRRHRARESCTLGSKPSQQLAGPFTSTPAATSSTNINADMDEEVSELLKLRSQRNWRLNLMSKLERTSLVNASRIKSKLQAGDSYDNEVHIDVRKLVEQSNE